MFAVIETGGKQYRVQEGQLLKVESLPSEEGQKIQFDKVLLISNGEKVELGAPYLTKKVTASVVAHGRHDKIRVLKFKRRKNYLRQYGHRQNYTQIKIEKIGA